MASGVSKIGEIISSKGGQSVAAMLEGLASGEMGKKLLDKFSTLKQGEDSSK